MPYTARKPALKRGRKVRWPVDPDRFAQLRKGALLTSKRTSDLLGVSERTIHNWEKGRSAIPYAAFKLLRLLTGAQLPGEHWRGFWIQGATLWTPEGKGYDAGELAYISNVFAMARFWLRDYHAANAQLQQARLLGRSVDRRLDLEAAAS